jgi:hypothetical protein
MHTYRIERADHLTHTACGTEAFVDVDRAVLYNAECTQWTRHNTKSLIALDANGWDIKLNRAPLHLDSGLFRVANTFMPQRASEFA